jgi:type IV secretion system protein TrbL
MDASLLTFALDEIGRAVVTGFGLLGPDAEALLRWAMALSYSLALVLWLWEGRPAVHGPFLRMLLKFFAVSWLLEWFPAGSQRLMQAAAGEAARLVPGGLALDDPGRIAWLGLQAVEPLMGRIRDMLGPVDFFLNFLEIVLYLIAALVVLVAFCVLAIQVFLAFLEYRVLSLAVYVAIPFAVLAPTSFIAERAVGYVASTALRLLVLGIVVSVCGSALVGLSFEGTPTLAQAFGVAVLSAAVLVLAIKAPRAAAGLVNGGPVFDGVTALASLWAGARAGWRAAATGAAIGAGGAGIAALAASAAMRGAQATVSSAVQTGGGPAQRPAAGRRYPAGAAGTEPMTAAQRATLDRLAQGRSYTPGLSRAEADALIRDWQGGFGLYGEGGGPGNAGTGADRAGRREEGT